jgi:Outer membrane protein beta-barrel domain
MRTRFPAAALAVLACVTTPLMAQSAQRWSIQASGLYVGVAGDAYDGLKSGPGAEVQVRVTPSLWSYGAGVQYSTHSITDGDFTLSLSGVFFEPRRVFDVGSAKFAPYLSARVAYLSLAADFEDVSAGAIRRTAPEVSLAVARRATATISAGGVQGNVGGGVLMKLSPRVNLDLGATIGGIRFGKASLEVDGRVIETSESVTGTGQNVVVRAGLAIGLGGGAKKPAPRR